MNKKIHAVWERECEIKQMIKQVPFDTSIFFLRLGNQSFKKNIQHLIIY